MNADLFFAPRTLDLPDGTVLIALHDGVYRAAASVVRDNAGEDDTRRLQATFPDGIVLDVNAFALRRQEGIVLVDTGAGEAGGSELGSVAAGLASVGIAPGNVGTVLLTHMDGDHVFGLFAADGTLRYREATVWCPRVDHELFGSDAARAEAPEAARRRFDVVRRVIDGVGPRLRVFDPGEVLPGIEAVPLPGHTPGHSGFLVGSLLLITGDVLQLAAVQGMSPGAGLAFDHDPAIAERTRRDVLESAMARSWYVAGAHIPFPGIVTVGEIPGGYRIEPFEPV